MWKSISQRTRLLVSERAKASSASSLPAAWQPPTTAPIEVPTMTSGSSPTFSSALMTPI